MGSAAMQYATNGSVDPIQLGVDGVIGAGAGGVAAGVGAAMPKSGAKSLYNGINESVSGKTETVDSAPNKIAGYTKHGLSQVIGRDGGLGVSTKALRDTISNPTKIVPQYNDYGKIVSYKYISKKAIVVLNDAGKVVTAYAKGSKWTRGYK